MFQHKGNVQIFPQCIAQVTASLKVKSYSYISRLSHNTLRLVTVSLKIKSYSYISRLSHNALRLVTVSLKIKSYSYISRLSHNTQRQVTVSLKIKSYSYRPISRLSHNMHCASYSISQDQIIFLYFQTFPQCTASSYSISQDQIIGETGDNCNTGHVVTGDPTPRENDLRWLF